MRFIFLLAVSVLALGGGVSHAQTLIKVGVAQSSVGTLPLLAAEQNGYFADEGVEVETYQFRGGAPTVQALASGSIDVCVCAGDHAVRLRSRGLPAKIIAGLTERHGYAMLALSTSEVLSLDDLAGRTLGITSPGSLTDNSARYVLSDLGLNPDRDLTFASIGVGIPMKAALDTGSIDVGMFTTPDVQAVMAGGDYKIIYDFRSWNYTALDLIALDEALTQFERQWPEKAKLVKLRYFAGFTTSEAAKALGVSVRTAERNWTYAKVWLLEAVQGKD